VSTVPCPFCDHQVAKQESGTCPKCGGFYEYDMDEEIDDLPWDIFDWIKLVFFIVFGGWGLVIIYGEIKTFLE